MSRWLCCIADMGAALSQEGGECDAEGDAPPTMADVIRERKKKAGSAPLSTLRRRLARRRDRSDRDSPHARHIRSVVSSWQPAQTALLLQQLRAGAALRTQADRAARARPGVDRLGAALGRRGGGWTPDCAVHGAGWTVSCHVAVLTARSGYCRGGLRPGYSIVLDGQASSISRSAFLSALNVMYMGQIRQKWDENGSSEGELDILDTNNSCCTEACAILRIEPGALYRDIANLLHTGEYADVILQWGTALELRAHRVILAARSRLFRKLLSRGARTLSIDEVVFPRRYGQALLHVMYTDTVDLNLVTRAPSSPTSGNSTTTGSTSWSSNRGTNRNALSQLEDAFQLYEIARFLEAPCACSLIEDLIVSRLQPATLPSICVWAAAKHASGYVLRMSQRYLLENFPAVMSCGTPVPLTTLRTCLRSSLLQASEEQVLRGLLKWDQVQRDSCSSVRRRRADSSSVVELVSLVRTEHIVVTADVMVQAVRRGILPPPTPLSGQAQILAWLGVPPYRPIRAFMPYLHELKALLEHQPVLPAEIARAKRAIYMQRIPDTLYMVSGARTTDVDDMSDETSGLGLEEAGVTSEQLTSLGARMTSLCVDAGVERGQIALRCVREAGLPDSCAKPLLKLHNASVNAENEDREDARDICERSNTGMSSRGSVRSVGSEPECGRIPDVARAPNANTHLLTHHNFTGMGVLQLDLGDGATHTPRPGSRALRSASQYSRQPRETHQQLSLSRSSPHHDQDELRAAIEMSVYRAYSRWGARNKPHSLPRQSHHSAGPRGRGGSPVARLSLRDQDIRDDLLDNDRLDNPSPSHSRHYRLEPSNFGGSSHSSRGPSPSNYA